MANRTEQVLARISHKKMDDAKVLIVVDKYVSGKTLKNIFEEWGYDVTGVCTSSQEALVRVKKDKPDLILTDMTLDDCDGIYLAQQLSLQTDNTNISIYFTAYASDLVVQRTMTIATAMGCNINKYSNDKNYTDFETCFCQYYGIDKTQNLLKQLSVQPIRVLLVDDQQIVLWGLEKLIDSELRMEVVGTATNIPDAKRLVMEKQPNIIILNIYLDDIDCVSHIPDFSNNGNTRVVIFTETHDKEVIDRAILSGARGVVHRKESMQTILRAVEKIHNGELWLDRITTGRVFLQNTRMREKVSPDANTEKITMLTRKECMILRAFSDGTGGEQNKQIAAKLCMSEHTLRNHLTSIFSKLGIKNRFSLFTYAKQHFQQLESSANQSYRNH
ncbi:MAG: DNA-binding response regulator [Nitrosomonas sp.]|jgi:DNA-binding NarL/FixJ family response regulator|uniref:response regulator transcription factor n=1 Tax=Nitrosomonas sp. TaxID=42353 RepID=UPI00272679EA|nr:DNA-binding response regulator [Nitrosomonas sp.]MBK6959155.1 response regulator [Nitrosomonas sp.]MDO8895946.1 DNA-binding response regulator [Nitrosomonas sp.]MDO9470777.1 DNA-binding response regulator [Nitrosomonas sp.]MDP1549875.1 DNA-binding response regulator [Nitrosomonas sp.]MDP1786215.1 DNA-binding response regulator [Nitrosomonas sp.]